MRFIRQSILAGLLIALWSTGLAHGGQADYGSQAHGGQPGTITERAALQRLFSATTVQADWFAPQFLAHVPLTAIQQIDAQLPRALGPFQGVSPVPYHAYYVTYQQGLVRVTTLQLDAHGRILSLQPTGPELAKDRVLFAGYHPCIRCQETGRP